MTTPINPLREAHDQVAGDSWVHDLIRSSLLVAEKEFYPDHREDGLK